MRNFVKAMLVVAAVVPAMAFAAITNTKHDLASGSTATTRSLVANGTDQTCIFCHTPHRAVSTQLLWNRSTTSPNAYTWGSGVTLTTGGTTLATSLGVKSLACLSCHDGTIGIGDVLNSNGAAGHFQMQGDVVSATDTRMTNAGGALLATGGSLAGNHPISIPYPQAVGTTYNTIITGVSATNLATGATPDYNQVTSASCTTPTGWCTAYPTYGANITIYQPTANSYGIECGSCHDVHNKYPGNPYFLRVTTAQSQICRACHIK